VKQEDEKKVEKERGKGGKRRGRHGKTMKAISLAPCHGKKEEGREMRKSNER